jgi:hypothetical protein
MGEGLGQVAGRFGLAVMSVSGAVGYAACAIAAALVSAGCRRLRLFLR